MTDPKRGQNNPEKGPRKSGQEGTGRETQRKGERNPEPHKKGSGSDKETRRV